MASPAKKTDSFAMADSRPIGSRGSPNKTAKAPIGFPSLERIGSIQPLRILKRNAASPAGPAPARSSPPSGVVRLPIETRPGAMPSRASGSSKSCGKKRSASPTNSSGMLGAASRRNRPLACLPRIRHRESGIRRSTTKARPSRISFRSAPNAHFSRIRL